MSSICYGVEGNTTVWDSDFDILREQAYVAMKDKVTFASYLPENVSE